MITVSMLYLHHEEKVVFSDVHGNCINAIWSTQKEGSEPIFTAPSSKKEYFKDIDGEVPDEGNEVNELNKNKLLLKQIEFLRKWTNSQKKKMDETVKQQIHKNYLDSIYENFIKTKQEGKSEEEAINIRRKTIEKFKKDSIKLDEIYYTFKPSIINWEKVARVVDGRLPIECQSYWMNNMRPSLNRNLWTETERNKLFHLMKKYSKRNWIQISKELNNNRVPFQCLQEYLRYKNKIKSQKDTTPKIPYQILRPYKGKRVIKPPVKWTPEEDEKLKLAVKLYGERWNKVSILIPGRTDGQCRERYKNALDPQELFKLLELADLYAPNWAKIAKELNTGRTNRQVKNQFEKLSKKRKRMNEREAFYSRNIVIRPYNLPNHDLKYNPEEAGKYGVKIAPANPKPFIPFTALSPFSGIPNPSLKKGKEKNNDDSEINMATVNKSINTNSSAGTTLSTSQVQPNTSVSQQLLSFQNSPTVFPKFPFMIPPGNIKLPLYNNVDASKIKKNIPIQVPPLIPFPFPVTLSNIPLGSLPLPLPVPKIPISNINSKVINQSKDNGSLNNNSNKSLDNINQKNGDDFNKTTVGINSSKTADHSSRKRKKNSKRKNTISVTNKNKKQKI
ncbi:hypothetical protein BCR32DRAFT_244680 [Anaeromyces robustus]|uniref:Uncharacterized protein n=1 Tax=Anaeromyces robustus TaxID=1754192 RepID=A0A1Y1X7P9_9FUNG|nr:hypothetical protein BCR32DRAFT_244680 [Anaeromyces robustus]|eukprot:ORX81790.1 hypothetical protein BCR32DRAFT_244680 [Anaeromyces robustus]